MASARSPSVSRAEADRYSARPALPAAGAHSTSSSGSSKERQNAEATKSLIVDAAGSCSSAPSPAKLPESGSQAAQRIIAVTVTDMSRA